MRTKQTRRLCSRGSHLVLLGGPGAPSRPAPPGGLSFPVDPLAPAGWQSSGEFLQSQGLPRNRGHLEREKNACWHRRTLWLSCSHLYSVVLSAESTGGAFWSRAALRDETHYNPSQSRSGLLAIRVIHHVPAEATAGPHDRGAPRGVPKPGGQGQFRRPFPVPRRGSAGVRRATYLGVLGLPWVP